MTKISKQHITKSAEGFPVMGWLIFYKTSKFSVPFTDFVDLLKRANIDVSIARETLPKNAYIRAVNEKRSKDVVIKKIESDTETTSVIASVEMDLNDAQFQTEGMPKFDKATREIKNLGKFKDLQNSFDNHKTQYQSDQFRTVVLRYLKRYCSALTVLDTGGLYFVPATHESDLKRLEKLFELIGRDCHLTPIPQMDTSQAKQAMWSTLVGEVTHDIAKLKENLEDLPEEISEKSQAVRLKKYKELRTKVEMYELVLSGTADSLKKELDGLTEVVKKKIIA